MSKKTDIRNKTLGAKSIFKSKIVTYEGEEIEIKQPSVKDRMSMFNNSSKDGNVDPLRFQILAMIELCYVPGTGEKVFEMADYDSIINSPTNSFVDVLSTEAVKMMNVESEGDPTQGSGGETIS